MPEPSKKLEDLEQCLALEFRGRLAPGFLRVIRDLALSIEEMLEDPDAMADVHRRVAGKDKHRGDLARDRATRATQSLEQSSKYQELLRDVRALGAQRPSARRVKGPPTEKPRMPPYVDLLSQALEEAQVEDSEDPLPIPPPIVGGYAQGLIWVEADPWVPHKFVGEYCKALQKRLGDPPTEVARPKTLALYAWVKRRRRGPRGRETWRETTGAWNRTHERRYSSETNLHRDFHKIQATVEQARQRFEDLREAALRIEFEQGRRG